MLTLYRAEDIDTPIPGTNSVLRGLSPQPRNRRYLSRQSQPTREQHKRTQLPTSLTLGQCMDVWDHDCPTECIRPKLVKVRHTLAKVAILRLESSR
jgi:hypothetical protein